MPVRQRDSQKHKVYAWETAGFLKPFWDNSLNLSKTEVIYLCRKILKESNAPIWQQQMFRVDFSKRNGSAHANHAHASFTPTNTPKILVIHEMAHALTWGTRDFQGHGDKYLSCYMALLEKYLNLNVFDLAASLRKQIEKTVHEPVYIAIPVTDPDTKKTHMARKTVLQKKIKKINPPVFDAQELKFWRERLGTI